jgi:hypothetical protein
MDGLPFTDSAIGLLDSARILHPVRYDERGGAAPPEAMMGSDAFGQTNGTCEDWTSTSEEALMFGGAARRARSAGSSPWPASTAISPGRCRWPVEL